MISFAFILLREKQTAVDVPTRNRKLTRGQLVRGHDQRSVTFRISLVRLTATPFISTEKIVRPWIELNCTHQEQLMLLKPTCFVPKGICQPFFFKNLDHFTGHTVAKAP